MSGTLNVNLFCNNANYKKNLGLNTNKRGKIFDTDLESLKSGLEQEEIARNRKFLQADPQAINAKQEKE